MYLIDTMVFSELYRQRRHPGFMQWLGDKPENELFVSAITIGEIERGIERQRRRDPSFAVSLLAWLERSIVALRRAYFAGDDDRRATLGTT